MSSYTKLFSSIITSTVWSEDNETRIVWITMLALSDRHGEVAGSIPGLARMANVSVEACEAAINKFLSPDPYSRTKDDEGRRLEVMDGGWVLLNHEKYRHMKSKDEIAEKERDRKRRYRERLSRNVPLCPSPSTLCPPPSDAPSPSPSSKESEPRASRSPGTRLYAEWLPSEEEMKFALSLGLDGAIVAASFRDYWVGAAGAKGRKADWTATWRNWCRREAERRPADRKGNGKYDAPVTQDSDSESQWRARLKGYHTGGFWPNEWGPRPESGQCHAPGKLLIIWRMEQP